MIIPTAIDVWALGVTLYCLVYGKCPFMANSEYELLDLIANGALMYPWQDNPDLMDLLSRLLEKDPEQRATLHDVKVRGAKIAFLSNLSGCQRARANVRFVFGFNDRFSETSMGACRPSRSRCLAARH
jgi:serine/threonine protein kinase